MRNREPQGSSSRPGASLAVTDLRFAYRRGGEELFSGLDHRFLSGAVTAVTGPSGRGKSTLLYVLGLMLRPSSGAVVIEGSPVSALSDAARSQIRASRLGFVFQDAVLDPSRQVLDSVVEPALYAGRRRRDVLSEAMRLLDGLGVAERAAHKPGEISGGQAQRVAVARALINQPSVVLADEPTGNLDEHNSTVVMDALRHAASRGNTVVIATHDPLVVASCDQVLRL